MSSEVSSKIRVLLVDDDEDDFVVTRSLFTELGRDKYQLEWARSFTEGRKAIAEGRHDIYLLDYYLGEETGLELLARAVSDGCKSPLILLTGRGDREVDMAAMKAGAADYLIKDQIDAGQLERSILHSLERSQTLEALRQSEERYAIAVRGAREGIWDWDLLSNQVYFSPRWKEMLGFSDSEIGHSPDEWFSRIHPENIGQVKAELTAHLAGLIPSFQSEHRMRHRLGHYLWMACQGLAIRDQVSGKATRLAGSQSDITEQLSLEAQFRQAQKMESVGQLAAGVAHDFNNILTVIQGHADLMMGLPELTEKAHEPLREISAATRRASNLTRQLLTFSRRQIIQPKPLDLNEVIANIATMLQRILGEDVSLEFKSEADLPAIFADAGMMEQVVMNLALNSRDAMPDGGHLILETTSVVLSELKAQQNREARPGHFVALSVSDSGCGMDEATLSKIFEPFFTTKEVGHGTGLGLATVYGIVKQHEGWIEVESQPGEGTTFRIFFPASSQQIEPVAEPGEFLSVAGGKETILLVEDEPGLRGLQKQVLESYGYTVLEAASGDEAWKLWPEASAGVDLLLTDMIMPGQLNGKELARKLTSEKPGLKVIYVSGYSGDVLGDDFFLQEGINFLQKPYHPFRLAQMVRNCLDAAGPPGS